MHQDATGYGARPHPRRLYVRFGPCPPSRKGAESPRPIFGSRLLCQTAAWINIPLGTDADLGLRDIVLGGDPAPPPLKGHSPQFSANIRCGQTAGWTKMPLGVEVGLS